ncbi:hypothetical protein I7X30_12125 [Capnocytophaga sp. 051621]|jgi:hypothetical protein|uniref:Uncharacterized protein n=2 Tax=Capnocytophaga TaxID=1016 RepID=A0ABS1YYP0_9FLAO|nr:MULTISPECIES: hypothetical protein [Capnocytophaga]MBI1647796.1 hypothetical protein [Capnocytophaga periodontitidis]MBM0651377.1 hypothetical protein [Capnocytophaga genosp. AHN8471]MBM0663257.1 hypothetical protein [Capnocytophaga genosp. AHN8471]
MKLIVLKGEPDAGKTVTINYVYNKLRGQGYIESSKNVFKDLENGDFLTVLEKENVKLGVISQGDYAKGDCSVKKHLESLENQSCSIVICAQTIGENKEKIQKAIDKYSQKEIVTISKIQDYKKRAQEINGKVIEILKYLEEYLKTL